MPALPLFLSLLLLSSTHVSSSDDQAFALLSWKEKLTGGGAFLSSWAAPAPPCRWSGVLCNSAGEIVELRISYVDLHGPLPSNLQSLPQLKSLIITATNISGVIPVEFSDYKELVILDLSGNQISGEIPSEICLLPKLQSLFLHSNSLSGKIPPNIGMLSELINLTLYDNNLSGEIPTSVGNLRRLQIFRAGGNPELSGGLPEEIGNCTELILLGIAETGISGIIPPSIGSLKKLQTIAIYTANLSGSIPHEISECVELKNIYLYQNSLSGFIPPSLGALGKLQNLLLWQNNFAGSIPSELGSCRELKVLDLSVNSLTGIIPPSFGDLTLLEELQLSSNNLSGPIPRELSSCVALTDLELDKNQLSGAIEVNFSRLSSLSLFIAWQNNLSGGIPQSLSKCQNLQLLDLSFNGFSGEIPREIFLLQNLSQILLIENNLSGNLPLEIGSCSGLFRFRASGNKIEGEIPPEIGKLQNLNFLDLGMNLLSGEIPPGISDCRNLEFLDLHSNFITGNLPPDLPKDLQILDLGDNSLEGQISPKIGFLSQLTKLDLGRNKFSGSIPPDLGSCKKLQLLDLGKNSLSGSIPPELGQLPELEISFNLSYNLLSGEIPSQFSKLSKLSTLDLSHNQLSNGLEALSSLQNLLSLNISFNFFSGQLPDSAIFHQLPQSNFAGNNDLSPPGKPTNKNTGFSLKIAMFMLITVSSILTGAALYLFYNRRSFPAGGEEEGGMWEITFYQKLDLLVDDVVRNLTSANIIGTGSSGVVYRVVLPGGEVVAVKKMWSAPAPEKSDDDEGTFRNEISSLGSIRHRNITRLLGYAANRSTKLLFYSYHPNGSLSSFIHGGGKVAVDWDTRYEILLGVAHAVAYLHHDCLPPILHGDVKSMNVLLGPNYEPYLADFGLARPAISDHRSSPRLAGSYGYIAPEHASAERITEKSDVYSYGVVLLEVLTGKHPLDPSLPGGRPLVQWATDHWQNKGDPAMILDPRLKGSPESKMQEMVQVLAVAALCLSRRPRERPTMKDVVALLEEIAAPVPEAPKDAAASPLPPSEHPTSSPSNDFHLLGGSSRSFVLSDSFS